MARRKNATGYIGPNGELDPFCNEDGTDPETGRQEYPYVSPEEVARRTAMSFPPGVSRGDVNKLRIGSEAQALDVLQRERTPADLTVHFDAIQTSLDTLRVLAALPGANLVPLLAQLARTTATAIVAADDAARRG